MRLNWMQTLGIIGNILTVLVLLIGLIVVIVSYFKGKSRVALIGAIGLLIMFLSSCCSTTWGLAEPSIQRVIQQESFRNIRAYLIIKNVGLFLGSLFNLVGLVAIIAAIKTGSKKD